MTADKPEAGRTCEPSGLYRKFVVERTNGSSGPGGKHEHCDYFVLDWEHDKFAIHAALAYAKACEAEYPELARDLRDRAGAAVAHAEPARKIPMNPAPRPVERCSCEESVALRNALKEIAQIPQGSQGAYGKFARASNIARRALKLGEETDNG